MCFINHLISQLVVLDFLLAYSIFPNIFESDRKKTESQPERRILLRLEKIDICWDLEMYVLMTLQPDVRMTKMALGADISWRDAFRRRPPAVKDWLEVTASETGEFNN